MSKLSGTRALIITTFMLFLTQAALSQGMLFNAGASYISNYSGETNCTFQSLTRPCRLWAASYSVIIRFDAFDLAQINSPCTLFITKQSYGGWPTSPATVWNQNNIEIYLLKGTWQEGSNDVDQVNLSGTASWDYRSYPTAWNTTGVAPGPITAAMSRKNSINANGGPDLNTPGYVALDAVIVDSMRTGRYTGLMLKPGGGATYWLTHIGHWLSWGEAGGGDVTAPVISNVAAGAIGATSATVTWTTDEASTSKVIYGLSGTYNLSQTVAGYVTAHSVALTGMTQQTQYSYKVISTDAAGNTDTSASGSFLTKGAPVFTTLPSGMTNSANEDALYTDTVAATDPDGDALVYSVLSSPAGLTVNSATGIVLWTPVNNQVGLNYISIRVTDATGASDTLGFSITALNTNDAPLFVLLRPAHDTTVFEGDSITFKGSATDPDIGDAVTYFWIVKGQAAGIADSCRIRTTSSSAGTDTIKVITTDGKVQVEHQWLLTILHRAIAPVVVWPPNGITVGPNSVLRWRADDPDLTAPVMYKLQFSSSASFADTLTTQDSVLTDTILAKTLQGRRSLPPSSLVFWRVKAFDTTGYLTPYSANNNYFLNLGLNTAPQVTSEDTVRPVIGSLFKYLPTATDPEGDLLALTVVNLPTWLTYISDTLMGVPTAGRLDTTFKVMASDGIASDTLVVVVVLSNGPAIERAERTIPRTFALLGGMPNPFNPSTVINIAVPATGGRKQRVTLLIYDISGRRVRTLLNNTMEPGYHAIPFDGKTDRGGIINSGVYLCKMSAGGFEGTKSILMMK